MRRRAFTSLALLLALTAPACERSTEPEAREAPLDELLASSRATLERTNVLSQELRSAWQSPDAVEALCSLAADEEAFATQVSSYLAEYALEELPEMQRVIPIPFSPGGHPAVRIETAAGDVRIAFDPTLDPAQLVSFEPLEPGAGAVPNS